MKMSEPRYNVIFEGRLVPEADLAAVKANLAKVFRMDAARVEALFSGRAVVLKKDADQATALKFRAVLRNAGAECRLEPLGEVEEVVAAPPPAEPEAPSSASGGGSAVAPPQEKASSAEADGEMELVGTIRTAGEGFSGPFDVAPVGADIADEEDRPAPVEPDISGLSMAPPGEELEELPRHRKVEVPDVSHLSIAPLDDES